MQSSDYCFLTFVLCALLLVGLALYRLVVRIGEIEFGLGVVIIAGLTELLRYFGPLLLWDLASGEPSEPALRRNVARTPRVPRRYQASVE
jgi:hypothetical protein